MRYLAIYLILLTHISMGQFQGQPFIDNYAPEQYQGGMQNWWIIQDSLGNIYSANNRGVLRYDGTSWSLIDFALGKKTRSLDISKDGLIYVGGENELGYLKADESGALYYHSLIDLLAEEYRSFEDVWRVLCLGDDVYFQTFSEVFHYSGDSVKSIKHQSNLSFGFKFGGTIGVGDYDQGLLYYVNGEWLQIPGGGFFKNKEISSVIWNNSGWLVAAVDDGLYQLGTDGTLNRWGEEVAKLDRFTKDYLLRLTNENIALATRNNGLIILDPSGNMIAHFTKERGLNSQAVLNIYEDREGNLWCGLNDGLSKIELAGSFSHLSEEIGIQGAGYNVFVDDNKLYLCARNGLFLIDQSDSKVISAELVGTETGQTFGVNKIGNDLLLAAHSGAYRVEDDNGLSQLSDKDGWWGFLPIPDREDLVVAGTYDGLYLMSKQSASSQNITKIHGFDESSRLMVFENQQTIWVSHGYKGAFRLTLSKDFRTVINSEHYGSENGFPSNTNINVFELLDHILFTSSQGIFTYNTQLKKIVPFKPLDELLLDNTVYDMSADSFGNVYFIGKNEVGVLRRSFDGAFSKDVSIFEGIRPLLNDDFPLVRVVDDHNVIFGAKEGFIHFDPTSLELEVEPIKTYMTSLSSSLKSDSLKLETFYFVDHPDEQIELPYAERSMRVSFSAPHFTNPVEYSTQMEGLDNNQWTEWSNQTFREFSSLMEGSYRFSVKAKTSTNRVSEPVTIVINIAPPWYRSVPFLIAVGLFLFGLLVIFFVNQRRKYKNEREGMMITQQKELSRKDSLLEEISSKSQLEIQRLENEKSVIALEHKSRELASSTMNLLKKNETMKKIMSDLKSLKTDLENSSGPSKAIARIIKNIDRSMNSDQDWDTFQMYFDEVHGDFSRKLRDAYPQITPTELKLCTFIRLNMSSKDIANLLNVSIRSVETNRYRFRKKLNLDHDTNLTSFIMEL
ncbi:MAG: two-component regulator propeller domain-containing protein [Cyclobacteriaceae bacterium]